MSIKRLIYFVLFVFIAVSLIVYGTGFFSVSVLAEQQGAAIEPYLDDVVSDRVVNMTFEGRNIKAVTVALKEPDVIFNTNLGGILRLGSGTFFLTESQGCPT